MIDINQSGFWQRRHIWDMQLNGIVRSRFLSAFILFLGFTLNSIAHTLPISSMMVVPDADYLHVELSINPFELNCLPANSWEQNGRIDEKTLQKQNQQIANKIAGALKITVGGKLLHAETAGVWSDADSHHLTFLAHYRADALHQPLVIESELGHLTSSSHVTEVTYQRGERQQLARFDAQVRSVQFDSFERGAVSTAATATAVPSSPGHVSFWTARETLLLGAVGLLIFFAGFIWKVRGHLQPQA